MDDFRKRLMKMLTGGSYAVERSKNAPIMDAFWDAYGTNGTIQAGKLSNPDYITMAEAAAFTGSDLNPTGGATGSIFYPQRNTITHFEEFRHFSGVTAIPAYCFCGVNNLANIEFPEYLTAIGSFAFATSSSFNNATFVATKLPIDIHCDFITTIASCSFAGCAITSFTADNVVEDTSMTNQGPFRNCRALKSIHMENCTSITAYGWIFGMTALETMYVPKLTSAGYWFYNVSGSSDAPSNVVLTVGSVTTILQVTNTWTIRLSKYATNYQPSMPYSIVQGKKYEIDPENTSYRIGHGGEYLVRNSDDTLIFGTNNPANTNLIIDDSVKAIGKEAFGRNGFYRTIDMPSSIQSIANRAFSAMKNVEAIYIRRSSAPNVVGGAFGESAYGYTGQNTAALGTNRLYVPRDASGYSGGEWDALLDSAKGGFTISPTL